VAPIYRIGIYLIDNRSSFDLALSIPVLVAANPPTPEVVFESIYLSFGLIFISRAGSEGSRCGSSPKRRAAARLRQAREHQNDKYHLHGENLLSSLIKIANSVPRPRRRLFLNGHCKINSTCPIFVAFQSAIPEIRTRARRSLLQIELVML
jgi:hypothetical protein